jgi:hypothetical protein
MLRTKWTVGLRNKLSELSMECDSCAAIDGAGMSITERRVLQNKLNDAIEYIDKKILPHK